MYEDLLVQDLVEKPIPSEKDILGSEVEVVCGRVVEECYVAAVDRSMGITLHTFSNDAEIFCLNREDFLLAAERRGFSDSDAVKMYNAVFNYSLSLISSRKFSFSVAETVFSDMSDGLIASPDVIGDPMSCAFK